MRLELEMRDVIEDQMGVAKHGSRKLISTSQFQNLLVDFSLVSKLKYGILKARILVD